MSTANLTTRQERRARIIASDGAFKFILAIDEHLKDSGLESEKFWNAVFKYTVEKDPQEIAAKSTILALTQDWILTAFTKGLQHYDSQQLKNTIRYTLLQLFSTFADILLDSDMEIHVDIHIIPLGEGIIAESVQKIKSAIKGKITEPHIFLNK